MAQIEIWEVEERVARLHRQVDQHTQQLDGIGAAVEDMERVGELDDGNFRHQVGVLEDEVRLLSRQMREFMRWEPWLLRVWRWWYGMPPSE